MDNLDLEEVLPVAFDVDTNIPLSRGLGSSAACIVMGIMAAFDITKRDFDKKEILKIATKMEGHPDNVAPAIFGNAVASILKEDQVYVEKFEISNNFKFLAIIPDFKLPTKEARDVLPKTYSKEDAVFNLSRLSMVILSLISGDEENLKVALDEKIHEPYRLKLIPEIHEIEKIIDGSEALGHCLSGAGSTIILVLKAMDKTSEEEIKKQLRQTSKFL
ncbi:homoserine kinase [Peptoniphilus asaccharolyticus]